MTLELKDYQKKARGALEAFFSLSPAICGGIAVRSQRNKANRLEQMFVDLRDQPRQAGS